MFNWLKSLFSNPKTLIKVAVDSLDFAVPFLSAEIAKIEKPFEGMTSDQKSQWVVDKTQEFLIKKFNLVP